MRTHRLLADAWRHARDAARGGDGNLVTEKFLEDALAAALEFPQVATALLAGRAPAQSGCLTTQQQGAKKHRRQHAPHLLQACMCNGLEQRLTAQ